MNDGKITRNIIKITVLLMLSAISQSSFAAPTSNAIACPATSKVCTKPGRVKILPLPMPKIEKHLIHHGKINYTIASTGKQIGIFSEQLRVIKQQNELDALLAQTTLMGQVPVVDFAKEQLIAIFATGSTNGCRYGLTIKSIIDKRETVVVAVKKSVPGQNRICLLYVPQDKPYIMVNIPTTAKPVSLIYSVVNY